MTEVEGGVTAPKGFRASGVYAGLKKDPNKKDCALVVSDVPASVAGMFTTNVMKSPPVFWNIERCKTGSARCVFVNSAVANACTGERGKKDVETTAELLSKGLGISKDEVTLCSTGVIGAFLPMDKIEAGITGCVDLLSIDGSHNAARAIMTTDTKPKEYAVEVPLASGAIRIGAIAKGAGMVAPNMATMICILTTDAEIAPGPLQDALRTSVNQSFNRICIDNDMSTSDTVLCFANGQAQMGPIQPETDDYKAFVAALTAVCQHMAKALVMDGEGVTKLVEIAVSGAATDDNAKTIARALAHSLLCKTAFFGEDPNWGRFACAAGYAGIPFDPNDLSIRLENVVLVENGQAADYAEADAAAVMKQPEFRIDIRVGDGPGTATYWTSDLSHQYVSINADYRS